MPLSVGTKLESLLTFIRNMRIQTKSLWIEFLPSFYDSL